MNSDGRRSERIREFAVCVLEFMRDRHGGPLFDEAVAAVRQPLTARRASLIVGDLVEWTQDLVGDELSALDRRLASDGLPTLTLMRRRQDREIGALIARGAITSDEEWRLVTARLSDTGSPLPESDRAMANRMIARYESERSV